MNHDRICDLQWHESCGATTVRVVSDSGLHCRFCVAVSFDDAWSDLYILLSTCPLVVDEAEIAFTPLGSDVNFGAAQENGIMMWTDYVDEFNGFSALVELPLRPKGLSLTTTCVKGI
eukprot:scaffold13605_cov149-Skeletonema_marinoi.AAC.1